MASGVSGTGFFGTKGLLPNLSGVDGRAPISLPNFRDPAGSYRDFTGAGGTKSRQFPVNSPGFLRELTGIYIFLWDYSRKIP